MRIDCDHAIRWRDLAREPRSKRTGTIPFMSSHLLKAWGSEKIAIHHPLDLESFLWVVMWVVAFHDTNKAAYKEWRGVPTAPRNLARLARSEFVQDLRYAKSKTPRQAAFFRLMSDILTELESRRDSLFFAEALASPLQTSQLEQYKDMATPSYHKIFLKACTMHAYCCGLSTQSNPTSHLHSKLLRS
ncbi:hypothetical protein BOTBODRAFT_259395 [Botryobasidium botryosum FD-172 SS1]|uniref:Fungal-type protein kinase domain-containing protein n=1 Tax=Botryobasidium botryosum (strain FD-172 SS1) TaxID=930990 RepID=A0A067MXN6_BOTB1|nr:hypothetical protein BOTBODRAFT_259395 [Botryobasidium botryosum FD-172 SS1]